MRTLFSTLVILLFFCFCIVPLSFAGETCEAICQNIKASKAGSSTSMDCAELCHNIDLNVVPTAAALCKRSIRKVSDYDLCTELVLDLLLR